jgi:segregation and condensation protein A
VAVLSRDLADKANTNGYKVKLENFEGPLDLLLYLIKKEEIDIYDIPISHITEHYLEHIKLMQVLNIDVAGEFLLMAATLIHIKSKMLLPPANVENGEVDSLVDPRNELVHRLLEHKKFRAAAEMLWSKAIVERAVFVRAPLESDRNNPEVSASIFDLIEVFKKIQERRREHVEMEIVPDEITMLKKLVEIKEILKDQNEISAFALFERARSNRELVIIFLALLELAKESVIRLIQDRPFEEIRVIKVMTHE